MNDIWAFGLAIAGAYLVGLASAVLVVGLLAGLQKPERYDAAFMDGWRARDEEA